MQKSLLVVAGIVLSSAFVLSQGKPLLVVNPVTTGPDVTVPYDVKQLTGQLVAEFKVELGKQFDIADAKPEKASGNVYTLDVQITRWQAGNAAKRILVGFGSGRESADIVYSVTDAEGRKPINTKDTIRTNFYSQSGSSGTLGHPFAQKISERIEKARLK